MKKNSEFRNNRKGKEKDQNNKSKKAVLITLILILLVVAGVVYFVFIRNNKFVNIDGKKVKVNNIEISFSDDHKSLKNSSRDVAAYLKYKYDYYDTEIGDVKKCYDDKYKYCYSIGEKDTIIHIYGNNENTIDLIKYYSKETYPTRNFADLFQFLFREIDKDLYSRVNKNFIEKNNASSNLSYVDSSIRLDWKMEDKALYISISFVDYDQDSFKLTDEYKEQYKNFVISVATLDAKKSISSNEEVISADYNDEKQLADLRISYSAHNLTKVKCVEESRILAHSLKDTDFIDSVDFECKDDDNVIFYVVLDNIKTIDSSNYENISSYYDSKRNKQNVTLDILKENEVVDYKNSCSKLNYRELLRYPEQYSGKNVYWFGEVVQVVSSNSYRVNVNCTKYSYIEGYNCPDTIYVNYSGDTRIIEDDMVKIYGTMAGTKTYTTVMGASVTVPNVDAKYIDLSE